MKKIKKPKSVRKLHKDFWKLFSEYVRRRDSNKNGYASCISCGQMHHWKQMDCGHYISRGHWAVRYNEHNTAAQCKGCNAFLQGNAVGFRAGLVKRYGEEAVQEVEKIKNFPAGYTRDGLQLLIEEYTLKLKKLKGE